MLHANQDMNVVLESYHANMKTILKSTKKKLMDCVLTTHGKRIRTLLDTLMLNHSTKRGYQVA